MGIENIDKPFNNFLHTWVYVDYMTIAIKRVDFESKVKAKASDPNGRNNQP